MDSDIHPLLKKILDNIKPIALIVTVVVLAAATYSGLSSYQSSQKEQAASELGTILIMNDNATRLEHLEAFVNSGHKDLRLAARLELAKAFMDLGEYARAAQTWREIGQHVESEMKVIAGLGEASSLIAQDEYGQAVELLTKLKTNSGAGFIPVISSSLVFAAEKAGLKDIALAEYESLKTQNESNSAFIDYKINRLKAKP